MVSAEAPGTPWKDERREAPPPQLRRPAASARIVWFGEALRDGAIDRALMDADLFVSVARPRVYRPRASYRPRYAGARTLELNLEPSLGSVYFDEMRTGPAGALVPAWAEEILGSS